MYFSLGPPGFHTTARELQTCTFEGSGLHTPPKFNEETHSERQKERNSEILGGLAEGPAEGCPTLGGPNQDLINCLIVLDILEGQKQQGWGFNGRRPRKQPQKQQKAATHKQQEPHKQKQIAQTRKSTKQQQHRKKAPTGSAKAAKEAAKAAQATAKAAHQEEHNQCESSTSNSKSCTNSTNSNENSKSSNRDTRAQKAGTGLFVFSLASSRGISVSRFF